MAEDSDEEGDSGDEDEEETDEGTECFYLLSANLYSTTKNT